MNSRARAPRRYALVPEDGAGPLRQPGQIRRYSLARLAPSSRSALGVDRLERFEEVALRAGGAAQRGRESA